MEQSDRHNPLRYIDPTGHIQDCGLVGECEYDGQSGGAWNTGDFAATMTIDDLNGQGGWQPGGGGNDDGGGGGGFEGWGNGDEYCQRHPTKPACMNLEQIDSNMGPSTTADATGC